MEEVHTLEWKHEIGLYVMKRTTIFLGDADRSAIQAIKDRFGISSDSDAIRLALRVIAGVPNAEVLLLPAGATMADGREQAVGELSQAR